MIEEPVKLMEYLHLDPKHFPYITKDTLPKDLMLKFGVVPLGMKNSFRIFYVAKRLNLGVLGKLSYDDLAEIKKSAKEKLAISEIRTYRVDPSALVEVFVSIYGMKPEELKKMPADLLDVRLFDFLQKH